MIMEYYGYVQDEFGHVLATIPWVAWAFFQLEHLF